MSKSSIQGRACRVGLFAAFVAGAAIDGWLRTYGPPKPVQIETDEVRLKPDATGNATAIAAPRVSPPASAMSSPRSPAVGRVRGRPRLRQCPASAGPREQPASSRTRRLRVPIDGENIESLKGGFAETRGGSRPHEAVDMLAPRNTPVHAVENGTIAKLFTSKAGGLTIYQFDPAGHLCYYYAHLERYADGLKDGQAVSQGDVIGYVGTSGNAPPNTPHLHFAVFELNADKRWWQGRPLDPYLVFRDRG